MYLNDGDINREVVKSKYGSIKRFLEQLTTAHNMVADVIVNNKLISTSIATFSVNSGYVLANIDARFALTKQTDFNAININIHPANSSEDVITSYTDNLTEGIPANDVDADLWFKVGSLYPFNSLKLELPASYFNSMRSENMPKIDFSKLKPVVTEGGSTEESGSTDNTDNTDDQTEEQGDEQTGNNSGEQDTEQTGEQTNEQAGEEQNNETPDGQDDNDSNSSLNDDPTDEGDNYDQTGEQNNSEQTDESLNDEEHVDDPNNEG